MSIQYPALDSNSQPSDYKSPPLTTRPGLPPKKPGLPRWRVFVPLLIRTKQNRNSVASQLVGVGMFSL